MARLAGSVGGVSPIVYAFGSVGTLPHWVAAFVQGCPGATVQEGGPLRDGAVAMFGHVELEPLLFQAQREERVWYYGDHAYFGRNQFYRCTRNAMQHDGLEGDADPRRFRSFGIPVRDWRTRGDHILLSPNSSSFLKRHGHASWVDDVTAELRKYTDRPIRKRWKADKRPLAQDLRDCWAVVTFSSNAAVEAVLAGIPVFCTRQCAASAMGSSNLSLIERPRMPDGREAWAARLANNQWTLPEMAQGKLWQAIGQ